MYKITYIPTGHAFVVPDEEAKELKRKYPDEYKIIEKNGKKFRDKVPAQKKKEDKSIYSQVVEG